MSLVPVTPVQTDLAPPNAAFWPEISSGTLRTRYRVDGGTTDEQIYEALRHAIRITNTLLDEFRLERMAAEQYALADVDDLTYADGATLCQCYEEAVYSRAKAWLIDRRRDVDTTKDGHDRAKVLETTADEWLRQAHGAVRALLGYPSLTVELI